MSNLKRDIQKAMDLIDKPLGCLARLAAFGLITAAIGTALTFILVVVASAIWDEADQREIFDAVTIGGPVVISIGVFLALVIYYGSEDDEEIPPPDDTPGRYAGLEPHDAPPAVEPSPRSSEWQDVRLPSAPWSWVTRLLVGCLAILVAVAIVMIVMSL